MKIHKSISKMKGDAVIAQQCTKLRFLSDHHTEGPLAAFVAFLKLLQNHFYFFTHTNSPRVFCNGSARKGIY